LATSNTCAFAKAFDDLGVGIEQKKRIILSDLDGNIERQVCKRN
jgi:hypothetical protein